MQTIRQKPQLIDLPEPSFTAHISRQMLSQKHIKAMKISESLSWIVSFGIILLITGGLKFLKLGITMSAVTSGLFYLALAGIAYFIFNIIRLNKMRKEDISHAISRFN
jgi:hypothetical protein